MLENYDYPQSLIDDLYDEGDRDYIFWVDLIGCFDVIQHHIRERKDANFSVNVRLEKTFLLSNFLIGSHVFAGFQMKEYGKPDRTFDNPKTFEDFIRGKIVDDVNYLDRICSEDRYSVGLIKILPGRKAPVIPMEIRKILQ